MGWTVCAVITGRTHESVLRCGARDLLHTAIEWRAVVRAGRREDLVSRRYKRMTSKVIARIRDQTKTGGALLVISRCTSDYL